MGNKPAGARYPHATTAARTHDHRWCPIIGEIARAAAEGREQWGTLHTFDPVPDQRNEQGTGAADIKQGFYRARSCRLIRTDGLPPISVQADYDRLSDGTFRPWCRVFTREQAKAEIVRRVNKGETLAYNPLRRA